MTDEEKRPKLKEGEKIIREELDRLGLNQRRTTLSEDEDRAIEKIIKSFQLAGDLGSVEYAEAPVESARGTTKQISGKAKQDRINAGKAAGAQRQENAQRLADEVVDRAKKLLRTDRKPHELSSIIARNLGKSASHIRTILRDRGILKKRN